jgi:hypothetical protein
MHVVVRLMPADTHIVPSDVHADGDHPRPLLILQHEALLQHTSEIDKTF